MKLITLWEIKDSIISGRGVFAVNDLEENFNLGLAFEKIKNTGNEDMDYKRTELGAFVNHSKKNNLKIVQEDNLFYYFTNKKIKKGEELFLDYNDFN